MDFDDIKRKYLKPKWHKKLFCKHYDILIDCKKLTHENCPHRKMDASKPEDFACNNHIVKGEWSCMRERTGHNCTFKYNEQKTYQCQKCYRKKVVQK